jgi:hypothetical protein
MPSLTEATQDRKKALADMTVVADQHMSLGNAAMTVARILAGITRWPLSVVDPPIYTTRRDVNVVRSLWIPKNLEIVSLTVVSTRRAISHRPSTRR